MSPDITKSIFEKRLIDKIHASGLVRLYLCDITHLLDDKGWAWTSWT